MHPSRPSPNGPRRSGKRREARGDCLLLHSVYDKNSGNGVDEGNLWGDYFYAEALLRRARPEWVPYWYPSNGRER